jgi:DNA-binding NarL/FixJ family response regulator
MTRVRIFLADGDDIDIQGRASALASKPMIEVIGTTSDGNIALQRIAADRPDLVVLDVRLAPMGGFEVARQLKLASGAPIIVLMSHHVGELAQRAAAGAGADLMLAKAAMIDGVAALALRMSAGIPVR